MMIHSYISTKALLYCTDIWPHSRQSFQLMDLGFLWGGEGEGGLFVYLRNEKCHSLIQKSFCAIQTVNSPQRGGEWYRLGVISLS